MAYEGIKWKNECVTAANYFNRLGSFERCSYKIFNWQVGDSWGILCILHVLNVLCALLQLYIYSHYGVINEQVMPPLPRHEYGRMGAVCRRSRGMGNGKVNTTHFIFMESNGFTDNRWTSISYARIPYEIWGCISAKFSFVSISTGMVNLSCLIAMMALENLLFT